MRFIWRPLDQAVVESIDWRKPIPARSPVEKNYSQMKRPISLRDRFSVIGVGLSCVLIGYAIGTARNGTAIAGSHGAQTFSEIEYARQTLDETKRDFLREWCSRYLHGNGRTVIASDEDAKLHAFELIAEIRAGVAEFDEMQRDQGMRRFMFSSLDQNQKYDAWVDEYLKLLYEMPDHELLRNLRSRALELASETQRKSEVLDGLSHWDSIPAGFAGKPKLILPPIFFGEPNQPVRRAVRQQSDNPNNSFP